MLVLAIVAACGGGIQEPAVPRSVEGATSNCAGRAGGAEIEIQVNVDTFRLWSVNARFIDHAKELKASGKTGTAMLNGLADGQDCDSRWTFHSDPADMSWPELAMEVCDGRPSDVEHDKAHWISDIKRWCPWGTKVLSVDDRR